MDTDNEEFNGSYRPKDSRAIGTFGSSVGGVVEGAVSARIPSMLGFAEVLI